MMVYASLGLGFQGFIQRIILLVLSRQAEIWNVSMDLKLESKNMKFNMIGIMNNLMCCQVWHFRNSLASHRQSSVDYLPNRTANANHSEIPSQCPTSSTSRLERVHHSTH
jgi:hypothetical protein